jgi:hypothetical protein
MMHHQRIGVETAQLRGGMAYFLMSHSYAIMRDRFGNSWNHAPKTAQLRDGMATTRSDAIVRDRFGWNDATLQCQSHLNSTQLIGSHQGFYLRIRNLGYPNKLSVNRQILTF